MTCIGHHDSWSTKVYDTILMECTNILPTLNAYLMGILNILPQEIQD